MGQVGGRRSEEEVRGWDAVARKSLEFEVGLTASVCVWKRELKFGGSFIFSKVCM